MHIIAECVFRAAIQINNAPLFLPHAQLPCKELVQLAAVSSKGRHQSCLLFGSLPSCISAPSLLHNAPKSLRISIPVLTKIPTICRSSPLSALLFVVVWYWAAVNRGNELHQRDQPMGCRINHDLHELVLLHVRLLVSLPASSTFPGF